MRPGSWRVRWALLVLVAAIGVHAGRYAIAPPHEHAEGHGYLTFLIPALLAALLLSLLHLVHLALAAARGKPVAAGPKPPSSFVWLRSFGCLLAVYVIQETGESLFGGGGEHEAFALFGHGAWVIIPLAALAAAWVALLLRGAAKVLEWAARRHLPRSRALRLARTSRTTEPAVKRDPVARQLAPRGPPLVASS